MKKRNLLFGSSFLIALFMSNSMNAQLIRNNTNCDYVVKVHIDNGGACGLGFGPTINIPPAMNIPVGPLPSGKWVVGYDAKQPASTFVTVGRPNCGLYKMQSSGTCNASTVTFTFNKGNLIIN